MPDRAGRCVRKSESAREARGLLALTIALAGVIFAIDISIPLGYAGGVPYMALVLLGWWFTRQRSIVIIVAISTVLTILGYFLSPKGADNSIVVTNRVLALAAIWFTAALLFKARQTQQALRAAHRIAQESEARYAGIINIAMEAIITADVEGCIQLFNQGAEAIFGYRAEEVIGKPVEFLMPRRFRAGHKGLFAELTRAAETSRRIGSESRVMGLRKDGGEFPAEASISKLSLRGAPLFTVVLRDATAHKKAEEAIASRTRFFAAASHDLRQPLHAISLYLPALEQESDRAKSRNMIRAIGNAVEAMGTLLDSLLEMSRLDAGVIRPRLNPVAIVDIFEQLASEFTPQAVAESLELRVAPTSAWVKTDMALLGPILRNLMSNAIRYTKPGGKILLGARRRNGAVTIEIRDTGIGIDDEHQEAIFEEFYQVGNVERDRNRGLGLGLSIVRRLARLLEHPLELQSEPGRGTCFRIELPEADEAAIGEETTAPVSGQAELAGLLAMLVEDDAEVVEATRFILTRWRCDVIVADSVAAAEALVAGGARAPDFIVADLRLRGTESGIEAIRVARSAIGQPVPALLVTGETDPIRLRQAAESGLTLLHKPLSTAKLRIALEVLLTTQTKLVPGDTVVSQPPPEG